MFNEIPLPLHIHVPKYFRKSGYSTHRKEGSWFGSQQEQNNLLLSEASRRAKLRSITALQTKCPKATDRSKLHVYEYELETRTFVFRYLTAGERHFCSKILLNGKFQKTKTDVK